MKIAIGQMNIQGGQIRHNLDTMKRMVDQAKEQKADLIIFSELCVSGYLLADKWLDFEFCQTLQKANDEILTWSDSIGIIYGNLAIMEETGRDGRPMRLNCGYFCYNQKWIEKDNNLLNGMMMKHLNPDYRIFDDSRYFYSGIEYAMKRKQEPEFFLSPFVFEKEGKIVKIAIEICEDMWNDDYNLDVTKVYIDQGVDFIVNLSASPWTRGKEIARDKQIKRQAQKHGDCFVPFIYVNACGMQNNGKTIVTFDGDSTIYDRYGNRQACCNACFEEECLILELGDKRLSKPSQNPVLDSLFCSIREMDRQVFGSNVKWIIGLSGGLDSTINAALLCYALGSQRVIGYNLASSYNSETTKNNAHILAENLQMEIREGSIEKITQASIETLKNYGYSKNYNSLVYENIQARVRGHLLSTFASAEKGVVINNGNKVEIALGYCTLYGDAIGAFCPLGDCTKVQLFELAYQINELFEKEIIPQNLLPKIEDDDLIWTTPPSAELKDAQQDPMKWFYHDWLIEKLTEYPAWGIENVMEMYLNQTIYDLPVGHWIQYYGLDKPSLFIQDLEWVIHTMQNNVFKRFQMPPVVMISRGSFGQDFREAQIHPDKTQKYLELKEKILAMK